MTEAVHPYHYERELGRCEQAVTRVESKMAAANKIGAIAIDKCTLIT